MLMPNENNEKRKKTKQWAQNYNVIVNNGMYACNLGNLRLTCQC